MSTTISGFSAYTAGLWHTLFANSIKLLQNLIQLESHTCLCRCGQTTHVRGL